MTEKKECLADHPRLKLIVDEHNAMRSRVDRHDETLHELRPAIDGLTSAVKGLHDRNEQLERAVDRHVNKAVGAIAVVGFSFVMVCGLLTYIYTNDQRATERIVSAVLNEQKAMQEQINKGIERDARGAAERELLFKALLKVIDGKR